MSNTPKKNGESFSFTPPHAKKMRWLALIVGGLILLVAIILVAGRTGVNPSQNTNLLTQALRSVIAKPGAEFIGKWAKISGYGSRTITIEKNGDQYLLKDGSQKIGASYKDGFLMVGGTTPITYIRSSGHITTQEGAEYEKINPEDLDLYTAKIVIILQLNSESFFSEASAANVIDALKSREILNPAIDTLHLREEWSSQAANINAQPDDRVFLLLQSRINVIHKNKNGTIFEVYVKCRESEQALRIAEMLVHTYKRTVGDILEQVEVQKALVTTAQEKQLELAKIGDTSKESDAKNELDSQRIIYDKLMFRKSKLFGDGAGSTFRGHTASDVVSIMEHARIVDSPYQP